MTTYRPRLTAPARGDRNWKHYTAGGHNYCIKINGDETLPNCVGYAWGRWRELLGSFHQLSRANAEDWYGRKDGYARGKTPKVGAVMCWRQGQLGTHKDGAGHVAIVEKVNQNGSVLISNSDYKGSRFYTRTIPAPYNIGSSFTFQGFIYPPVNYKNGRGTQTNQEVAKDIYNGKGSWGTGQIRKDRLANAGYDPKAVQDEINILIYAMKREPKYTNAQIAKQIYNGTGNWGTGKIRVNKLTNAGYDAAAVQDEVNKLFKVRKTDREVALEIFRGRGGWGRGDYRVAKLKAEGYDPKKVQKIVNSMF